ncbi:hypothetical protein J2X53_004366 [Pseudorhodobacter sp. 4114]|nr:hypothetical protein [Pseudorhodobacter sp. 4114]
MWDRVEGLFNIGFDHPSVAHPSQGRDPVYRHRYRSAGPVSVAVGREQRIEPGHQGGCNGGLHHPVGDGGDGQTPCPAVGLGDFVQAQRARSVVAVAQEPRKPGDRSRSLGGKGCDALPVTARTSVVASHPFECQCESTGVGNFGKQARKSGFIVGNHAIRLKAKGKSEVQRSGNQKIWPESSVLGWHGWKADRKALSGLGFAKGRPSHLSRQ